ncbi:hypothetical protein D3C72_1549440 [compost metagenome]
MQQGLSRQFQGALTIGDWVAIEAQFVRSGFAGVDQVRSAYVQVQVEALSQGLGQHLCSERLQLRQWIEECLYLGFILSMQFIFLHQHSSHLWVGQAGRFKPRCRSFAGYT